MTAQNLSKEIFIVQITILTFKMSIHSAKKVQIELLNPQEGICNYLNQIFRFYQRFWKESAIVLPKRTNILLIWKRVSNHPIALSKALD